MQLSFDTLQQIVRPTIFGMAIPDRVLLGVMGRKEFGNHLVQRELYFTEYRKHQFLNEGFPLDNINEVLRGVGVPKLSRKDLLIQREAKRSEKEELLQISQ